MSERKRACSPASENTLMNELLASGVSVGDVDLPDSFVENIIESDDQDTNSEFSDDPVDDTDEDPDYQPGIDSSDEEQLPLSEGRLTLSANRLSRRQILSNVA